MRDQLQWSLQIVQPDDLTADELDAVKAQVATKKRALPAVPVVELRRLPPCEAVQILHVGPFREEPSSIAQIHAAIKAEGGVAQLGHREIYLSDLRRTPEEKLKTILRVEMTR